MDLDTLTAAVDEAFLATSAGMSPWPAPRGFDEQPSEEEYSRCLDPGKYRLLSARADAWVRALSDLRLADARLARVPRGTILTPTRDGALAMHVAKDRIEDVPDAVIRIHVDGVSPAIAELPACGCDACDDGSEPLLTEVDENFVNVVTGGFVHVAGRGGWAMTNLDGAEASGDVPMEAWLDRARAGGTPRGTVVIRGLPWWE